MANNNIVRVYVTLRKEKMFVGTETEFDDDLTDLSGQEFWESLVEPLVAYSKQEFIKDYEKIRRK